jgi:hypothetical protein
MIDLQHFTWPVLRVNEKHIQRLDSANDLLVESEYFLSRGLYEAGTLLIDAGGQEMEVVGVRKLRRSYSWKYWGAKNTAWVLSLDLGPEQRRTLDAVKEFLLSKILGGNWHTQGDYSLEGIRNEIRAAKSFGDLYRGISFFGRLG